MLKYVALELTDGSRLRPAIAVITYVDAKADDQAKTTKDYIPTPRRRGGVGSGTTRTRSRSGCLARLVDFGVSKLRECLICLFFFSQGLLEQLRDVFLA